MLEKDKTYRKGKRERKVLYFTDAFVYYKTKSDIKYKSTSFDTRENFEKWMKGAEMVVDPNEVKVLKNKKGMATVIEYQGNKYNLQHPTHYRQTKNRKSQ